MNIVHFERRHTFEYDRYFQRSHFTGKPWAYQNLGLRSPQHPEPFVPIIFSLVISALLQQDYDYSKILEIIGQIIYEPLKHKIRKRGFFMQAIVETIFDLKVK